VLVVPALAVVGQYLDHLAGFDPAMGTALDHALKFRFKRQKARDLFLDLGQPRLGNDVRFATRLVGTVLQ
jgi:hypothetical protein